MIKIDSGLILGESEKDKHSWVVLNADGTVSLSLELPIRLDVQKIRSGLFYGIHRSEEGNERVLGYEIRNEDLSLP